MYVETFWHIYARSILELTLSEFAPQSHQDFFGNLSYDNDHPEKKSALLHTLAIKQGLYLFLRNQAYFGRKFVLSLMPNFSIVLGKVLRHFSLELIV